MLTRDQARAVCAFGHVNERAMAKDTNPTAWKQYKTIVFKLPSLLQSAGLCQTLHFARARGDEDQKVIVDQLAAQLRRVNGKIVSGDALLATVRNAGLAEYLQLTDEAMACAAWYRRLVQGAE